MVMCYFGAVWATINTVMLLEILSHLASKMSSSLALSTFPFSSVFSPPLLLLSKLSFQQVRTGFLANFPFLNCGEVSKLVSVVFLPAGG